MTPRYYVQRKGPTWLVLDRMRIKLHNDIMKILPTRKEARALAKELNDEERQDRRVDSQIGETI
jgi:hypothetical protein